MLPFSSLIYMGSTAWLWPCSPMGTYSYAVYTNTIKIPEGWRVVGDEIFDQICLYVNDLCTSAASLPDFVYLDLERFEDICRDTEKAFNLLLAKQVSESVAENLRSNDTAKSRCVTMPVSHKQGIDALPS